jgi:fermentation-respiration switch protein FrsA (DUF1100 family)
MPKILPKSSIQISDPHAVELLQDALRRIALPQAPLSAPMLVVTGLDDPLVPAPWVSGAVADACRVGGQIDFLEVRGAGHGDLGGDAYRRASQWMRDRFEGKPAPSNCGQEPETLSVG